MSQVLEGYERQYGEPHEEVHRSLRRRWRAEEAKNFFDKGRALIRKMDLEARSLSPNVKGVLLAKLREYNSDLNNLKSEIKRLTLGNVATRENLLE